MKRKDEINCQKRADFAISLIEKDSSSILELGSGGGEVLINLKNRGLNPLGLDINPEYYLMLQKKGIRIKKWDLNNGLPFRSNSFDVIIALEILEHLYNPYAMMEEIKRVLKKVVMP